MKKVSVVTPEELNPDDFELIDGEWKIKRSPSPINLFNSFGFFIRWGKYLDRGG